LPTKALSFEITESDLVEDPEKAIAHLNDYKKQGYELAIDDFGTGYSSLAYLKSFPVSTFKIDKSFVLKLSQNQDDKDIVETIMQLADKFNLTVVAEGVEDAHQRWSFICAISSAGLPHTGADKLLASLAVIRDMRYMREGIV
jgi:EAL domain-containing protein (putative c-di-GMP-specific phosphodiesterase class I)